MTPPVVLLLVLTATNSSPHNTSLKLYNNLVERCFKDCVQDFRSKNLAKDEEKVRESGCCLCERV